MTVKKNRPAPCGITPAQLQLLCAECPEISDKEFDDLMRELQDLEKEHPEYQDDNSPTMRREDLNKNFHKWHKNIPCFHWETPIPKNEVTDFLRTVKKALNEDFEICCELKYDGTSISLTYEDGN